MQSQPSINTKCELTALDGTGSDEGRTLTTKIIIKAHHQVAIQAPSTMHTIPALSKPGMRSPSAIPILIQPIHISRRHHLTPRRKQQNDIIYRYRKHTTKHYTEATTDQYKTMIWTECCWENQTSRPKT